MIDSPFILIGIGGFFGAAFRYELGGLIQKSLSEGSFPIGTFFVNVLGSLLLGIIFTLYQFNTLGQNSFLIFGTGFCGAFTTFSTFAIETVKLNESQGAVKAITNISANVLFTLVFTIIGIIMGNILVKYFAT